MTKIVGLTGGIGSGKSTVAQLFSALGVPVYIADDEAKKIMEDPEVVQKVQAVFEENIVTGKKLNRLKIAELVFASPDKLERLNAIVHPAVRQHFREWVQSNSSARFVIKEAAILFETGSYLDCDKIILVTAPPEVRIQRVMRRDSATREQVVSRMKNQWTDEEKAKRSDYVIQNIDLEQTKSKVKEILKELNKM